VSPALGARAISGFKWGGLSAAANVVFQLGFTAAMARLLRPADFGLMAMCAVALRLFSYFSQLGLAAALVQREKLQDEDVRLALGLTWVVCSVAVLGVVALAPALGWFFRDPGVVPLVRALSANLLLAGLGGVSTALLRRALRFREQAIVETTSYVLGFGLVGVTAASLGAGVWSLVAATYAQGFISLCGAWALARHPLRPSLRGDRLGLLRYGARHSLISFLEFLQGTLDSALIGRLLGEAALGLYNRALTLTYQPVERAAVIVARVLFPLLSAVQGDHRKVGGVFLLGVSLIGVFGGALSLAVSAAAADVVRVLLGPSWSGAVAAVQVLALAVPLVFMSQVGGVVCDALALLRFKLLLQSASLALLVALMLVLYPAGVRGIAWAVVAGETVRFSAYLGFLAGELGCSPRDVARVLGAVATTAALAYGAAWGAAALAALWLLGPFGALALEMAGGALALALGALAALRLLDGTEPARFADASVPGWRDLRARLGLAGASA
jgi:O-antigen/teichoic acid export membrane protein